MSLLITLAAFLAALAVLIVIHELGHFGAARLCGVKVLRFSVGFGRILWSRVMGKDGTEWVVSVLPIGGYVKMLDERECPVPPHELQHAFNRKSVWQRFFIVLAGPMANFLLAVFLYWLIFIGGTREARPILALPESGTPAAVGSISAGDTITAVDGMPVKTWQEARWHLIQAAMERHVARLDVSARDGSTTEKTIDFSVIAVEEIEGDPLAHSGLRLYRPEIPPVIGKLVEGEVGEKAGLQTGDRVASIDGIKVPDWDRLVEKIRANPDRQITLRVERGEAQFDVSLTPQAAEVNRGKEVIRIGRIGAGPQMSAQALEEITIEARYGVVESAGKAFSKAWETAAFSLKMIGRMIVGDVSWRNISGPITIADYAGQSAQLGLMPYLSFLALISVSLFVLNLLPVPLLDGGHLMYYSIEILKGSPVSDRAMELGQRVGMALLLFLMAFAFYNDIHRTLAG